jgi:hypothetical protein
MDMTFLGALATTAGLSGLFALSLFFSKEQRRMRELRRTPPTPIAHATHGQLVKIVGRVGLGAKRRLAPLSGRTCVHWSALVVEVGGRTARIVLDWSDSVDFLLEDESGTALVRGGPRLEVVVLRDYSSGAGTRTPAGRAEADLLASAGLAAETQLGFAREFRFEEGVLSAGERVAVLGVAVWEDDPSAQPTPGAHYRETSVPKKLVIMPRTNGAVLATDDPDR